MKRTILILVGLAVLLAACGSSATSLTGVTWTVTALSGVNVDPTVTITASFGTDGKIAGSGGCNNYTAAYTTSGSNNLTVESPASTMMSCGEVADQQESDYFYAL